MYLFGQVAGLGQTARVQQAYSFSLSILVAGFELGGGAGCLELRASIDHRLLLSLLFFLIHGRVSPEWGWDAP